MAATLAPLLEGAGLLLVAHLREMLMLCQDNILNNKILRPLDVHIGFSFLRETNKELKPGSLVITNMANVQDLSIMHDKLNVM
jgi:hypothetical protein